MTNKIFFNRNSRIISVLFVVMLVWWLYINVSGLQDTTNNFLYGAALGILPIIGFFLAFKNIGKWGGYKSYMGRALMFIAFGLFTWGIGTLIFAYYNILLDIEVPYPSIADAAYIISWPLWTIGMFYMSKATGAINQLKKFSGKLVLLIIPIIAIGLSYYLLIVVASEGFITSADGVFRTFFDIAYPTGDIVILTITSLVFILSFKYLGGLFKWPILIILLGFLFNYFADFSFIYSITKETFFVANWVDLLYTTAFFMLSLGVSLLDPSRLSDKHPKENNN